jgi:hypothetical protein
MAQADHDNIPKQFTPATEKALQSFEPSLDALLAAFDLRDRLPDTGRTIDLPSSVLA